MSTSSFAAGDMLLLSGLTSRPDLNGKMAVVTAIDLVRDRLAVKISESGESVRVRAKNTRRVDAPKGAPVERPIDKTLYVRADDGLLIQPGASSAPLLPAPVSGLEELRLPLPAGHWEVVMLEQEVQSRQVRVTMIARASFSIEDDWCAVCGLSCVRELEIPERATSLDHVEATVQGSELVVTVAQDHGSVHIVEQKANLQAKDPSSVMEIECEGEGP